MKPSNPKNEFIEKSTSDLIPYAKNARTHSPEQVNQIAASITEFGFTNPVLIDPEGLIIAGHGRVLAAKQLKIKNLPCYILHGLSEAQKRAYTIADNKLALNAGWDYEILAQELAELDDLEFNLDLIGFDNPEMRYFQSLTHATPTGLVDDDDVPPAPENPISKFGDIWQLGHHRLMCGDISNLKDIQSLIENDSIDLIITEFSDTANKDYNNIDKIFEAANSVLKKGAVFYIWYSEKSFLQILTALQNLNWLFKQVLIWVKSHIKQQKNTYNIQHESCLYGWKEGAAHLWASDRKQITVIELNKPVINHQVKPVELFEYQMLNNTKGMDAVLDLFGGSGTTIIAAQKHGRKAYLMEIDPQYCDVIIQRWQNYTGQEAIHIASGKKYNETSA